MGGVGDWVGVMRGGSFSTKSQIIVIFLHKKSIQPRKNRSFAWKKLSIFTQKDYPAPQKTELLHKKMTKTWLKNDKKKEKPPLNFWSFAWKNENRPAYGDFEEKKYRPPTSPNF